LAVLEKLYQKYNGKIEIIGVPTNNFMGQTPESDEGVAEFCKLKKVTFPVTKKYSVKKGEDQVPLYKYLISQKKGQSPIKWNFEKFLVDGNGKVVKNFSPGTDPLDKDLTGEIDKILK